jgi:hypothetical protein
VLAVSEYTTHVIEADLDYLTAFVSTDTARASLRSIVGRAVQSERTHASRGSPFQLRGFHGYQVGRVAWGERPDGDLVQLAGSLASELFDQVYPLAHGVSRLDLAVTVRLEPFDSTLARKAEESARNERHTRGIRGTTRLEANSDTGDTLYLNKRRSRECGRFYNKFAQSHEPFYAGCWRYECELKPGREVARALSRVRPDDRVAYSLGFVHNWFARRGVRPLYAADTIGVPRSSWAGKPDLSRHTRWLGATVAPVLASYRNSPHWAEILESLGLSDERLPDIKSTLVPRHPTLRIA